MTKSRRPISRHALRAGPGDSDNTIPSGEVSGRGIAPGVEGQLAPDNPSDRTDASSHRSPERTMSVDARPADVARWRDRDRAHGDLTLGASAKPNADVSSSGRTE